MTKHSQVCRQILFYLTDLPAAPPSDPPRFSAEDIEAFKAAITVKKGQKATFKLAHMGREPVKIQWYLDGEELSDESHIRIDNSEGECRLLLNKLQRKDSGEIKLKLKNEFGSVEAYSQLVVLGKGLGTHTFS